jgi:hypothetical protein
MNYRHLLIKYNILVVLQLNSLIDMTGYFEHVQVIRYDIEPKSVEKNPKGIPYTSIRTRHLQKVKLRSI